MLSLTNEQSQRAFDDVLQAAVRHTSLPHEDANKLYVRYAEFNLASVTQLMVWDFSALRSEGGSLSVALQRLKQLLVGAGTSSCPSDSTQLDATIGLVRDGCVEKMNHLTAAPPGASPSGGGPTTPSSDADPTEASDIAMARDQYARLEKTTGTQHTARWTCGGRRYGAGHSRVDHQPLHREPAAG